MSNTDGYSIQQDPPPPDSTANPTPAQYTTDFNRMAASGQPMGMLTPDQYAKFYNAQQARTQQTQQQTQQPQTPLPGMPEPDRFISPPTPPPMLPAMTMGPQAQQLSNLGINEPWIPTSPRRDSAQWGQPDMHLDRAMGFPGVDPSIYMPQPRDIPRLIHSAGGFFSRFGSMNVGRNSISMLNNYSNWVIGYVKGLQIRSQLAAAQMQESMDRTIYTQRMELLHAHEIWRTYDKDPQKRLQALRVLAQQNGDQYLTAAIDQGEDEAGAVLSYRDSWLQDLMKGRSQTAKQEDMQASLAAWGDPAAAGGAAAAGGDFAPRRPQAPQGPAGAPAQPGQPGAVMAAGGAPAAAADPPNESPEMTVGRQIFRNGLEVPAGLSKDLPTNAKINAVRMNGEANRILQTCKGGTDGNCMAQLSALDPSSGATLTNVLNASEGIPEQLGQGGARGPSAYGELIRQFALKINPQWSANNYKISTDYKPGGKVYGQLQATARLAAAGAQVLDAARAIGINSKPPANVVREWYAGHVSGTGEWARLYNNWRIYASMVSQIALGGVARTTYIQQLMNHVRIEGPKAVLAAMQGDANDALGAISSLNDTWKRVQPGRALPGVSRDDIDVMNAIANNMNSDTGTFNTPKIPRRLVRGHAGTTIDVTPSPAFGTNQGAGDGGWSITPVD